MLVFEVFRKEICTFITLALTTVFNAFFETLVDVLFSQGHDTFACRQS